MLQIDIPPPSYFIIKIPKDEYFVGKITYLSHLVAIENIKKKSTEPQLEMFRKSCFGQFLLFFETYIFSPNCPSIVVMSM